MVWIILLFIVLPFVELTLLLEIGSRIGALNTIGIVVATGIIGGYLAKREGLLVWRRFQSKVATGGLPGDEILDGVIVLASGALLITPGVITDVVGLLGLFPLSRLFIKRQLRKRVAVHTDVSMSSGVAPHRPSESTEGKLDITQIVERRKREETSSKP